MDVIDQRIRQRAHQIWIDEGHPEGRADAHWDIARELIAIEDHQLEASKPNPAARGQEATPNFEPVEPIEAVESLGDLPSLTDQGERNEYPKRKAKRRS